MYHKVKFSINENSLASLFGLSATEAIIAKHIALGKTLAQYSEKNNVTQHTVRSQLRSIFNKTNTHSQCELSNRVLSSPAIFTTKTKHSATKPLPSIENVIFKDFSDNKNQLQLPSGRSLCYADVGDPQGLAIVLLHGSDGCRLERHPNDNIAKKLGIRLIVPDRPGYGLSTPYRNQTGLEWCNDFEYLLQHLKLDKIHLLSTGSGSYYALACAQQRPKRLIGITMVNSMAPFESIREFSDIIPREKLFYAMARYTPTLFKRFLLSTKNIHSSALNYYTNQLSTERLLDKSLYNFLQHKVIVSSQYSLQGFIQEKILLSKPWDIKMTTISTPIELYVGGQQFTIPSSMSKKLQSVLPNSCLHYLPEQGMYLLYEKWQSLLSSIKN